MTSVSPSWSPDRFAQHLRSLGTRRAYFVFREGQLRASHPELSDLARAIQANTRDFDEHEAVFLELGQRTGALLAAFLHKTVRGQGAGGVRRWQYASLDELIQDGLRLSRGMGRKSALAGLYWGGGKGIIASPVDAPAELRVDLYRDYGAFVASLRGYYVTAEDVGTQAEDMAEVFRTTRHVTCIPPEYGGSGNPSTSTARGVAAAIEAALGFSDGGTLAGRRVVVQGLGNVARALIGFLLERGAAEVLGYDIAPASVEAARARFAGQNVTLTRVSAGDPTPFEQACDVFAPCALGGILNPDTIPRLRAAVVCGAANNQLLDEERDARLLAARGIVYVPDFVANRMGIVQCANEQYGVIPDDPAILRHFDPSWPNSLQQITTQVLSRARAEGVTPARAANALADELSREPHPLWPGRGVQIRDALLKERWEQQG